jgi:hypothetical protein
MEEQVPSGAGITSLPGSPRLTADQVRQTYMDLLNRTPTPEAIAYWTGTDTMVSTPEQLRQSIMDGAEFERIQSGTGVTPDQVQTAYETLLGRDPTLEDFEYWTGLDFSKDIAASESPTSLTSIDLIQQAISESPEFQGRVEAGLEQPFQPTGQGGMGPMQYTQMPGGIYGPGQAMPNIFTPAGGQPAGMAPFQPTPMPGTGTAAPGPRTMVSPGITTYAYPQPFGNIDIFSRPGAQAPAPMASNNMQQGSDNMSPAQRALAGNIFG